MSKTFVMGDIHGAHKALLQCLERSGFNNEEDTLIQIGDVVDGWSQSYECVEELLKIKNLVAIRGNHDEWFNEWLLSGNHGSQWQQGAQATYNSYANNIGFAPILPKYVKKEHRRFFEDQLNYYIDDQHRLFVHGGYNRHFLINETADYMFYWDRDMWASALSFQSMIKGGATGTVNKWKNQDNFKNIFIGHTTTMNWDIDKPMMAGGGVVYNIDTGAGFAGVLTIMDVETKSFWQSDKVTDLYPDEKGRK
jgi:serine/threonine protein phosphatase 1